MATQEQWLQFFVSRTEEPILSKERIASPESVQDSSVELTTVDSRFTQTLRDASHVTDDGSVRYGLYCLELDGKKGTVSATDGRQLVQISGFEFPWREEAILVRHNRLFRLADFAKIKSIQVGIVGDLFVIGADRWRFECPIERHCRFPNLENVIHNTKSSSNRIQLAESDQLFLNDCLPQLPGEDDADRPVTLNLNGLAAIVGYSRSNNWVAAATNLDRSVQLVPEMQTPLIVIKAYEDKNVPYLHFLSAQTCVRLTHLAYKSARFGSLMLMEG